MDHHEHPPTGVTPVITSGAPAAPPPHGEHEGHEGHEGHHDHAAMFRRLFWINLVLALPVLVFSETIQGWLGFELAFPGSRWIPPVVGTVIYLYGGKPFLVGGITEARGRRPGMMLLIALAITTAFAASVLSVFGVLELEFWWELATLIVVMPPGHWQEMKAIGQAKGALAALAELLPDEAERIGPNGEIELVVPSELQVGDVVLVRPGARVPADGDVVEGEAEVDESMLTGESKPVPKAPGDPVVAGSVVTDSAIRLRVSAVGEETALGGIQRLVAEAQASRSRAQVLADRAAGILFYVAVGSGIVTFVVWLLLGRPDNALVRTVAVLVIACPHALGLAIPLVVSLSTGMAARNGILVKDRLALERMRSVDAILFDKTGTLTKGEFAVTEVAAPGGSADGLLAMAAAVERDSEHPLARAIVAAAREQVGRIPTASDFRAMTGRGVEATVDGARVAVGGPALLRETGATVPAGLAEQTSDWNKRGAAVLHVLRDGAVIGAIALEDQIRPESKEAVDALHARGIRVVMITGDSYAVAHTVAEQLGVDEFFAEVLPEDKDSKVAELQTRGLTVAMVGDGVNDAPALARADVGIAIGAGTDVAIESAGIVLASDDPRAVVSVIELSRAGYRKMVENLIWAAGYNVAAIPLAAGAFAWAGITLPPALAAALMSLSTVIVAVNAQLLRRLDLRPRMVTAAV